MFITYPKIKRLGDEETDGILLGTVHIEEKIDGANTSIWKEEDGSIHCGSRNQDVTGGSFNGFVEYVKNHEGIQRLLADRPTYRLFGEWLVRHTIAYNETAYKKFYLYDIALPVEHPDDPITFLSRDDVRSLGEAYRIPMPEQFRVLNNPSLEELNIFVGQTSLGKKGEGVVLKNHEFRNKFGDLRYAKIVTQEFKEDNAVVFGGNNKHSETYAEMYCVNKYMTLGRVRKIMDKLQPLIDRRLAREHTARIIQTAYHDLFMEEMWSIAKQFQQFNFKSFERLATRKAAKIYHDILDGHISVAYESNNVERTPGIGEKLVGEGAGTEEQRKSEAD